MDVQMLLFRGSWANEGKFYALESKESIIILATGENYSNGGDDQLQELAIDYLKERNEKIKGIIVKNITSLSSFLLPEITNELGIQIPIFSTFHTKLLIKYFFPELKNKLTILKDFERFSIGDFICSLININSHVLGNCLLTLTHSSQTFYFFEELLLDSCWENDLLFNSNFLKDFTSFVEQNKSEKNYLITSFYKVRWKNNNSLFFSPHQDYFSNLNTNVWIIYDFDWLHILEIINFALSEKKKILVSDSSFFELLRNILHGTSYSTVISKNKGDLTLLVVNYKNIEEKVFSYVDSFEKEEKLNLRFFIGLPPVFGGENKLARVFDYIHTHTKSKHLVSYSNNERFNYGTSFSDWRMIINIIKPKQIILLQNSYKNSNYLKFLQFKPLFLQDGNSYDFTSEKINKIKAKKNLATLDEILIKQRKNLKDCGFLSIFLLAEWKFEKLELAKLKIESFGISSTVEKEKLENKIKNWWNYKLTNNLSKDNLKVAKDTIKRRLSELTKNYLITEYEVELEELPILLFFA